MVRPVMLALIAGITGIPLQWMICQIKEHAMPICQTCRMPHNGAVCEDTLAGRSGLARSCFCQHKAYSSAMRAGVAGGRSWWGCCGSLGSCTRWADAWWCWPRWGAWPPRCGCTAACARCTGVVPMSSAPIPDPCRSVSAHRPVARRCQWGAAVVGTGC
jgi:hypothetical protein